MSSQNTNSVETRLTAIVTRLRDDGCEFFLNSQLVPTMKNPDDAYQKDWPVDSQRVQDLLVSLHCEITEGDLLKSSERDFLMALLREESRKGGQRFTEVEAEETDKDVIVQAVLLAALPRHGQPPRSDWDSQITPSLPWHARCCWSCAYHATTILVVPINLNRPLPEIEKSLQTLADQILALV